MPQSKKTASYVILHYEIPALHCCGGLTALVDLIDAELKPADQVYPQQAINQQQEKARK